MNPILKKLKEADHSLQKANHLLKITFPLLKHKKILIRIIEEIKSSLLKQITAILYYEHINKNIKISKKSKKNFELFEKKLAKKYKINKKQLRTIKEILSLSRIQKESPVHILKEDKLILISKDLKQKNLTKETLNEYLTLTESLFANLKGNLIARTPIKE